MKKKEKEKTDKKYEDEVKAEQKQESADNQTAEHIEDKIKIDKESTDEDKTIALKKELEVMQQRVDEANDKFLRLFSEFDNYRKRVARERIELTKTASESIINSLLPVLDDLERAAEMTAENDKAEGKSEGVILIYNKFKSILRQKGVEEVVAVGEDFNTDFHDAVTHLPAKDKKQKGKIVEEVQKGYLLNGKVIRYARVVVAN